MKDSGVLVPLLGKWGDGRLELALGDTWWDLGVAGKGAVPKYDQQRVCGVLQNWIQPFALRQGKREGGTESPVDPPGKGPSQRTPWWALNQASRGWI